MSQQRRNDEQSAEQRHVADDGQQQDQPAPYDHGGYVMEYRVETGGYRLSGGGVTIDDQRNRDHRHGEYSRGQRSTDDDIGHDLRAIGRIEKSAVQGFADVRCGNVKDGAQKHRRDPEPYGRTDGQDDAEFKQRRSISLESLQGVVEIRRLTQGIAP